MFLMLYFFCVIIKKKKNMNQEEPEVLNFECSECGKPMETNKVYCSDDCFKASQL